MILIYLQHAIFWLECAFSIVLFAQILLHSHVISCCMIYKMLHVSLTMIIATTHWDNTNHLSIHSAAVVSAPQEAAQGVIVFVLHWGRAAVLP